MHLSRNEELLNANDLHCQILNPSLVTDTLLEGRYAFVVQCFVNSSMNIQSISFVTGALLCVFGIHAQESILDARMNYNLGEVVSIEGVVTSDENLGTVRYIQDETAGIVIYPGSNWNAWQATP